MSVSYPIRVPRKDYRGANPKKRAEATEYNRIAGVAEVYLNKCALEQTQEYAAHLYYQIAEAIGSDEKTVKKVLFGVDGGSNGLTIYRDVRGGSI